MIKKTGKSNKNIQILKDQKGQKATAKCCGDCTCASKKNEEETACTIRITRNENGDLFSSIIANTGMITSDEIAMILERLTHKATKREFPFDKGFK